MNMRSSGSMSRDCRNGCVTSGNPGWGQTQRVPCRSRARERERETRKYLEQYRSSTTIYSCTLYTMFCSLYAICKVHTGTGASQRESAPYLYLHSSTTLSPTITLARYGYSVQVAIPSAHN